MSACLYASFKVRLNVMLKESSALIKIICYINVIEVTFLVCDPLNDKSVIYIVENDY